MTSLGLPEVAPGMTLAISEKDYCYGRGMLLLRVTIVGVDAALLPTLQWVTLTGDELRHDSGALLTCGREVLVRVSSLSAARRPTGWLPASEDPTETPNEPRAGPLCTTHLIGAAGRRPINAGPVRGSDSKTRLSIAVQRIGYLAVT